MAYEWLSPALQAFMGAYGAYMQSGNADALAQAGQQAAGMADPFANNRAQFVPFLQQQVFGGNPYDASHLQPVAPNQYQMPVTDTTGYYDNLQNVGQDLQNTPGYQFRMNQGLEAVGRANAAKGLLNSGNTLQELTNYGQNFASTEYQNEYQRRLAADQARQGATGQYFNNALQGNQYNLGAANQQFGQLSSIYNLGNSQYNNQTNTLAQLSGAQSGSPAAAGQALYNGTLGSQAAYDQYLQSIGGAVQGAGQVAQTIVKPT